MSSNPQPSNPKLEKFRSLFKDYGIQAYVLPSTDPHQSEYLNDRDFRVKFLFGFSGSNAFTVITESKALLWTDGRYFVQATQELEPGCELMKTGIPDAIQPADWLATNLKSGEKVGFDPQLFEINHGTNFMKELTNANLIPVALKENLVDKIWSERPKPILNKILRLTVDECGKFIFDKFADLRSKMTKKKCDSFLSSCCDDIVWILNIRGFDIPYNPLVFSFLFVTHDSIHLFVDQQKLTDEVAKHLEGVILHDYAGIEDFVVKYHEEQKVARGKEHKVFVPDSTNYFLGSLIGKDYRIGGTSPIQSTKAIKNPVELEGMRQCHIRDSAAVVQFIFWLKKELAAGNKITELMAAKKMDDFRSNLDKFVSLSFTTIAAADKHAALPHYHPTEAEGHLEIRKDGVFLLDSGGQYRDGTTDVTRTVSFAEQPDPHFLKMFNTVLKGHIDTAQRKFPDGINGNRLDALSRIDLWQEGYDFLHGVGHGVGFFLNVHEGPIGISYRTSHPDGGLHAGQVITIEPGYYETDNFGIRIENCYEIVGAGPLPGANSGFLTFEPLTWVPIQRELIKKDVLDSKHIQWINDYHKKCLEKVGPFLKQHGSSEEFAFFEECCREI
uniref:Xaa-Pro aminopeptidase n=2 Tax=Panagrolaimus sp. JU765 TaxID=591449 RepID=A0AC34QG06_9BILA